MMVQDDPVGGFWTFVDKTVEIVNAAYTDLKSREDLIRSTNEYDAFYMTKTQYDTIASS